MKALAREELLSLWPSGQTMRASQCLRKDTSSTSGMTLSRIQRKSQSKNGVIQKEIRLIELSENSNSALESSILKKREPSNDEELFVGTAESEHVEMYLKAIWFIRERREDVK